MNYQMRTLSLFVLCIFGLAACGLPGSGLISSPPTEQATAFQATTAPVQPSLEELRATVESEVAATMQAGATTLPTVAQATATSAPTATVQPATTAVAEGGLRPTATTGGTTETIFRPAQDGPPQTVNIQLVFDSSGSMAEPLPSGETRIAAARRAMEGVIAKLATDQPNLNVGFRVFGHLGDNTDAGRALSCQSTELVVPMKGVNKELLTQATNSWQPTGWTPITLALQQAGESFPPASEHVRNTIVMVSDGEETCNGDPCAAAQALRQSAAEIRIDIIGFGLPPAIADGLKCIAVNSGGTYTDAADAEALGRTLELAVEATIRRSYLKIRAVGPDGKPTNVIELKVLSLQDQEGKRLNSQGEEINSAFDFENQDGSVDSAQPLGDGQTRIDLRPGEYTFTVVYGGFGTQVLLPIGGDLNLTEANVTAVVEEGKETVATVGLAGLTLVSSGAPADIREHLRLDIQKNDTWYPVRGCGGMSFCAAMFALPLDQQALLVPGRYRLVNFANSQDGDVLTQFTAETGQTVSLRLGR
jgi:Mg-chelatase subunit ChlD